MIERARWRPATGPRTPLGTLYGRDRWLGLPVGLWVAFASALACVVQLGLPRGWPPILLFLLFPLLYSVRKFDHPPEGRPPLPKPKGVRERLARLFFTPIGDPEAAFLPLEPRPSPGPCFYVEIALQRGRRTTGGDLGIVAFSDGWLVYEGQTTAFALSPQDVQKATREAMGWALRLPDDQALTLLIHGNAEWEYEIARWLREPPPDGLSRLPPLAPNRVHRLRRAGQHQAGAYMVAGLGLGGALVRWLHHKPNLDAAHGILALFTLALFAAGSVFAWNSNRDRPRAG